MWLPLALACTPQPDGPEPTITGLLVSYAGCDATDNALRIACAMELDRPDTVQWTVYQDRLPIRTFTTGPGRSHRQVLWGLPPDTDLSWDAVSPIGTAAGTWHTDPLPIGIGQVTLDPIGTPLALDHVALPFTCAGQSGLMLAGSDGVVRWYETLPPGVGLAAWHWSQDNRVVMVTDDGRVQLTRPTGDIDYEVGGFSLPLHHDVATMGEHTFVLNAAQHGAHVVDGLYVLDAEGRNVAEWSLADHVPVTGDVSASDTWSEQFPGAIDWSHANAVTSDGTEHLLLSLLGPSAVVRIVANPHRADFGGLDWVLSGVPQSDLASDFTWTDGGGFSGQHHALRDPSGGLSVFDNGVSTAFSRALVVTVDETTGQVAESASWSMGTYCPSQGGAYSMPDGGMVATCPATMAVHEFAHDTPEPAFVQQVGCEAGDWWLLKRGVPVTLD